MWRAQVMNDAGTAWIDGALFGSREAALEAAEALHKRYGNVARIVGATIGHGCPLIDVTSEATPSDGAAS